MDTHDYVTIAVMLAGLIVHWLATYSTIRDRIVKLETKVEPMWKQWSTNNKAHGASAGRTP